MSAISEKELLDRVKKDPYYLREIKDQTEAICIAAVQQYGDALKYVQDQTPEICLVAVKKDGYVLQYVKEQTEAICIAAVQENGYALRYVKEQTPEICLIAIQQTVGALQYVKEQTEAICMAAVQKNGYVLHYVKEQTEAICVVAVQCKGRRSIYYYNHPLEYVKNQTHQICDMAVSSDGLSLRFVNDNLITDDIVLAACLQTRKALQYTANKPFSLVLDCLIVIEKDEHLIGKAKEVLPDVLVKQWLSDHIEIKN